MAARKPQTRFVVKVDDKYKRLFSVREVSKGRLIVTTHGNDTSTIHNRKLRKIRTLKHSIHPTEKSPTNATMVHMTTEFLDGTKSELALLTHAPRDRKYQPIYMRTVFDPRVAPSLVRHPRDIILELLPYDPSALTLVYGLWFSSMDCPDIPAHTGYSSLVKRFSRFSIFVTYGYVPTPSSIEGQFINYATSYEGSITDLEKSLGYRIGIAEGATLAEIPNGAGYEMDRVLDVTSNKLWQQTMPQRPGGPRAVRFRAKP